MGGLPEARLDSESRENMNSPEWPGPIDLAPPPPPRRPRKITRRQAIAYGLCGAAGLSAAGLAAYCLSPKGSGALRSVVEGAREKYLPPSEIFRKDAPKGQLWNQWRDRGWAREAMHYLKLGANMQCKNCPNECLLESEDRGRCRNRVNKEGKLYTLAYGNPCAFHVDPIEKKPLFHFLPGTGAFSIATSGCPLRCLNCQNWDISQRKPEETKDPRGSEIRLNPETIRSLTQEDVDRSSMFPPDVVALTEHFACKSIAYTYSEPTAWFDYMYETAKLARERRIKNLWITCGHTSEPALDDLCKYIDAANVNLKSFSEDIYRKLNSGKLQPVLDTLKFLKQKGVWFEVTNLIVPTYTDKPDMTQRMCDWLLANIGPDYPLHFSRFHPAHKLTHLPPTPAGVLIEAREIARKAGLKYVYIGNAPDVADAQTTFCPGCKKMVIDREIYAVRRMNLDDGKCRSCGTKIAGVWSA